MNDPNALQASAEDKAYKEYEQCSGPLREWLHGPEQNFVKTLYIADRVSSLVIETPCRSGRG